MANKKYTLLIPILLAPIPLLAYLDPGSGSMLFSALIGIIATLFFVTKGLFYKALTLPAYLAGKKAGIKHDSHSIVFYCEGARYWPVFQTVVEELESRGTKVSYLTSDKNDPALSREWTHIETKYIGEGNRAFFLLNTLQTDICIMTTPGLDVLQIKRSRGVKKYVHITHAAAGCADYATYGTDYYDVVLTGGEGDIQMIQELESVRDIHKKQMEAIGCTYLDLLRKQLQEEGDTTSLFANDNKTVLLAPTWDNHGLLNKFGDEVLSHLTQSSYNVIVRPHPQSFVSDKELMDRLESLFPNTATLLWDKNPNGLKSMKNADIMVSDFSGVMMDYLFLFGRPVLTIKAAHDTRGRDSMDISEPWNVAVLDKIGKIVPAEKINELTSIIGETLSSASQLTALLPQFHNEMDRYPGESGTRGADALENILLTIEKEK